MSEPMMCTKCHSTEGPFICDLEKSKVLCEDCYLFDEITDKCVTLIKSKASVKNKNRISMTAVTLMDQIEISVYDKLEID